MQKINDSTLAALEEMLQNSARSAPLDFLPVFFKGTRAEKQAICLLYTSDAADE